VLFVGDFTAQNGSQVWYCSPKHKKAGMCLIRKTQDKLWSGMSYTAIGHEFDVN